jgi:hypothetical protein
MLPPYFIQTACSVAKSAVSPGTIVGLPHSATLPQSGIAACGQTMPDELANPMIPGNRPAVDVDQFALTPARYRSYRL